MAVACSAAPVQALEAAPSSIADDAIPLNEHRLFSLYKPSYFILGFDTDTQAKFQLSFKFELWSSNDRVGGPHAVFIAFTERGLWRLYDKSFPFEEANYNPDMFYSHLHYPGAAAPAGCHLFRERLGIEHESNGKEGGGSRSLNRTYGEVQGVCAFANSAFLSGTLRIWGYPWGISENPRYPDYVGPGEIIVMAGFDDIHRWYGFGDISARFRKGFDSDLSVGMMELDARWHPSSSSFAHYIWPVNAYLYAQFFTGYGETTARYNHTSSAFRIGIGLAERLRRYEQ